MAQLHEPRRTQRLILRKPELADLDDLSLIYANEEVNRYLHSEPRDRAQTLAALEKIIARPREISSENELTVAVISPESGRVIGYFILKWTANEHRQGEIGGTLHPEFHGRGFATEVYRELLNIGFADYSLHRLIGRCDGRNTPSIKSLAKAGLHQEAHFVENEYVKGEWTDEVVMAIRIDQWKEFRQNDEVHDDGVGAPNP